MSSEDDQPSKAQAELNSSIADLNIHNRAAPSPVLAPPPQSTPLLAPPVAYVPPISNNAPGFRYKYPQAKPTPEGVDDTEWNKIFTAADSRFYNKHGKNAKESEKYRIRGETYQLALRMLDEKREKNRLAEAGLLPVKTKKAPAPRKPESSATIKKEYSTASRDATPGGDGMTTTSIAEKIKSEGRRKAPSASASSDRGTPAPTTAKVPNPIPPPPKAEKPAIKKKGIAAPVKKQPLKMKTESTTSNLSAVKAHSQTPKTANSTDDESNDGGEYCICRGPDDHRMMVNCEGGCDDWYHCSCVGIDETDTKELLDRYVCPKCTTDKDFTTWKPMCRYFNVGNFLGTPACRKQARVTLDPPSKYCSDEHRDAFWEFVKSRVRDDDRPSMGGSLNQKEIGWILKQRGTAKEVHALGEKPRLPKKEDADPNRPVGLDYLTSEEQQEIEEIQMKKSTLEARIEGYTKQVELLKMINERAKKATQQPNLEIKDLCGYDNRLAMNEAEFAFWCNTTEGKTAFETGVLGPRTEETKSIGGIVSFPGQASPDAPKVSDALDNLCLRPRKKCKHLNWRELHNHDFVYNRKILRDELEKLSKAEAEIIDDAETREATKDYYSNNVTVQLF
ncbi:hypothetical protein B0O99DRAFT_540053 [Bisporella sp. PMI_857]|nr:hypothetical protein B0O99DRAFT_540053 [Bisporella sp. PMI_857]